MSNLRLVAWVLLFVLIGVGVEAQQPRENERQPRIPERRPAAGQPPQVVRAGLLTSVPASLEPGQQNYLALDACPVPAQFHGRQDRARPRSVFVSWGHTETPAGVPGGIVQLHGQLFSLETFQPLGTVVRLGPPLRERLPTGFYSRAFRNGNILMVHETPRRKGVGQLHQIILSGPDDQPRQYEVVGTGTTVGSEDSQPKPQLTLLAGGNVMAVRVGSSFAFHDYRGRRVDRMTGTQGGLLPKELRRVGLREGQSINHPVLCSQRDGLVRVFCTTSASATPLRTWLLDVHGMYAGTDVGRRELEACWPLVAAPLPEGGAQVLVRAPDFGLATCRARTSLGHLRPLAFAEGIDFNRLEAVAMPDGGFFLVYWSADDRPFARRIDDQGRWAGPPLKLHLRPVDPTQLTLAPLGDDQVLVVLGTAQGLRAAILK